MNAPCSPAPSGSGPVSDSEIGASCRAPLFVLFVGAAVWVVLASLLGLMASLRFHKPDLLADCAWLSYGRVRPAANNALLYGFALQAGLGVALWIVARSGRSRAAQPWFIATGAILWNLGVLLGVASILGGGSTGFEQLEMPRAAVVTLFVGYLIIGFWTALTLHGRREQPLEPSHWFLIAALFWFPWIYSTANYLLLGGSPVRGVMESVVAWWYGANLDFVWLGLAGVAAIFYFVPQIAGRPMHSRYLALLAFWTLILFGSWCGIPNNAPVPAWMPVLSTIATVLTLITVLSVVLNVFRTVGRGGSGGGELPCRSFLIFATLAFVFSWLMNIAAALPGISPYTQFTWYTVGQWQLEVYGFFGMAMFGAIYYIVPAVTGISWPSPAWARAHFWLAALGTILLVVPLAVGGIVQGVELNHQVVFLTIVRTSLNFLRVSTLGELFILLGNLLLVANILRLSAGFCRVHFLPAYEAVTAEIPAQEADL